MQSEHFIDHIYCSSLKLNSAPINSNNLSAYYDQASLQSSVVKVCLQDHGIINLHSTIRILFDHVSLTHYLFLLH